MPGHHQEMLEVQRLFAGDVQSISWLPTPDGRTSLMFVRSSGAGKNLKVYAFKGASGFLEQQSLHVDGTVPFNMSNKHLYALRPITNGCPKNGRKGKMEACDKKIRKQGVGARANLSRSAPVFSSSSLED